MADTPQKITWQTPEYAYYSKSVDWYWALVIITIALAGVAIYTYNFLFAVLIVIGAFAIAMYAVRTPRIVTVVISGQGVQIDDRLFPYDALQSFWIFYHPGRLKELSLRSEKIAMPHIKIPLGSTDPNEVRELLLKYIDEVPQTESLIDTLAHFLGF